MPLWHHELYARVREIKAQNYVHIPVCQTLSPVCIFGRHPGHNGRKTDRYRGIGGFGSPPKSGTTVHGRFTEIRS